MHCGGVTTQTALNAVLQGPYFDEHSLMSLTGGTESDAYTMNMALQSFDVRLEPARSRRSTQPLQSENAFLCFHEQRWYALRRFGVHWMHFKDTLDRPHNIEQVELCLSQLQSDGCEVYVVRGKLPACVGDERSFWHVPFSWDSLVRSSGMHGCGSEACQEVGLCMCDEDGSFDGGVGDEAVFDRRFEEDLRAAIAASVLDVGGGKGDGGGGGAVRIKRDVSSGVGSKRKGGGSEEASRM